MSTARMQNRPLPIKLGVAFLVVFLLLTLGYTVISAASILVWTMMVLAMVSVGLFAFVVYLLYRLVLVVEHIAYEQ